MKVLRKGVLLAFLLAGVPGQAHASLGGLIDFFGELSGPGPFKGATVYFEVACLEKRPMPPSSARAGSPADDKEPLELHFFFDCDNKARPASYRLSFRPVGGYLRTTGGLKDVPPAYRNQRMLETGNARVDLVPLGLRAVSTIPALGDRVEIGGTAGAVAISGTGFDRFWIPYGEFPNAVWRFKRPFDLGYTSRWLGSVRPDLFGLTGDARETGVHLQHVITFGWTVKDYRIAFNFELLSQ